MFNLTPDQLLLLAVVVTLLSVDGLYRARRHWRAERIGRRRLLAYASILVVGSVLAWIGFVMAWLDGG